MDVMLEVIQLHVCYNDEHHLQTQLISLLTPNIGITSCLVIVIFKLVIMSISISVSHQLYESGDKYHQKWDSVDVLGTR